VRVGVIMVALALTYATDRVVTRGEKATVLQRLGQNSLFIYWIHVELVYGYVSLFWLRRLPLTLTCLAYVAFVAVMYGAVVLRDRVAILKPWARFGPAPARTVTVS